MLHQWPHHRCPKLYFKHWALLDKEKTRKTHRNVAYGGHGCFFRPPNQKVVVLCEETWQRFTVNLRLIWQTERGERTEMADWLEFTMPRWV